MGKKRQNNLEESDDKNGAFSRKAFRKGMRKQLKVNKALHYAKLKNTNKVCISSNDLESLKMLQNRTYKDHNNQNKDVILSLKNKILANNGNNNNKDNKKKKKKKKKNTNLPNENVDVQEKENSTDETSFKLVKSSSTNCRLAKLQEYVNKEANKMVEQSKKVGDINIKLSTDKLIKDKDKVNDLMEGKRKDEIEINKIARKLKMTAYQKSKLNPIFVDDFGDILEDIDNEYFDERKYINNIANYSSDDKFDDDMKISLNGIKPHKSDKSHDNIKECIDIDSDFEEDESVDNFIDDEAEESENEDETDKEPEDKEDELLFESGSCISPNKNFPMNRPSINTIFDLYAKNSEDEEEEDSDLDGFIVDDDFIEYSDEEEPSKKVTKTKKSRIINREKITLADSGNIEEEEPIKKVTNSKKSKNINRKRITSGDSDIEIIEVDNDSGNEKKISNRKRIISESDCEEAAMDKELKNNSMNSSTNDNVFDVQLSILKKTDDSSKSKKRRKVDARKKKKRVSFTLPEDENNSKEEICEEYHEDIYGRMRDKNGNVVVDTESSDTKSNGKYIPPAMRKLLALNNDAQKKEQLAQLQKKLKGQLNRLAESNMAGIVSQIEGYYQSNSRNDMNDTITKLLFEMLVTPVMTPEKLAQDNALLIAILSANVGNEVGAHILTEFVVRWMEDLEIFKPTENVDEVDSKELDNMLMFICQLYNFKVMDSSLIYDILHKLLSRDLNPKEVDLILLILRCVGFTLRKDDPLALKSLISEINTKANEGSSMQNGETYSRIKFMLEILTAIKNNNMNKVPNYDPTHSQHLKQLMKGFIRKGCRTSELKISLADLLKSKVVGKWWIVGSAWSGGLKERNLPQDDNEEEKIAPLSSNNINEFSKAFQNKAAKMKMTRPPKINILYAITEGAANSEESFQKLIELNLPKKQEQEIFNVLIYCCMRCKTYAPTYNTLALKLVKHKKEFLRLLQFSIWDRFKDLESLKSQHTANLAKFVANLIADDGLNFSLFKNLDFAQASEETVSFLRQALISIFLHPSGTYVVSRAFDILCSNPKLKSLRQYIRIFIIKFIGSHTCEDKAVNQLLKSRVKLAIDKLTSVGGVQL